MTKVKTDYVSEYVLFFNKDFVIADSYTVIETGFTDFEQDQSITHAELNQYVIDSKDFTLDSIKVLPQLTS